MAASRTLAPPPCCGRLGVGSDAETMRQLWEAIESALRREGSQFAERPAPVWEESRREHPANGEDLRCTDLQEVPG